MENDINNKLTLKTPIRRVHCQLLPLRKKIRKANPTINAKTFQVPDTIANVLVCESTPIAVHSMLIIFVLVQLSAAIFTYR